MKFVYPLVLTTLTLVGHMTLGVPITERIVETLEPIIKYSFDEFADEVSSKNNSTEYLKDINNTLGKGHDTEVIMGLEEYLSGFPLDLESSPDIAIERLLLSQGDVTVTAILVGDNTEEEKWEIERYLNFFMETKLYSSRVDERGEDLLYYLDPFLGKIENKRTLVKAEDRCRELKKIMADEFSVFAIKVL